MPEPDPWMLPIVSIAAAWSWYMHWRWRTGRVFMSRFSTAEREAAKLGLYGPSCLPNAVGITAMAAIVALWEFSPLNGWTAWATVLLAVVFLSSAVWAVTELFHPSKRRTPPWVRKERSVSSGRW